MKRKIAAAAVTVLALAVSGFTLAQPNHEDEVSVTAMFADASPLVPGNTVRMGGVEVGQIESVTLKNGKAAVDMTLDPSVLPLHRDATAKIRPVTLLGERFIELHRGSDSAPTMDSPRVISDRHTSRAVDLDEVFNSLDQPTGAALAALLTTLGEGMAGQGPNIDEAIKALAPAMKDTQALGDLLNQQNAVLSRLVDRTAPIAESVAGGRGEKLDRALEASRKMLGAVAAQRQQMREALTQLPDLLRKSQRVLSEAAGVAHAGTHTLRGIRPMTDDLPEISEELTAFADSANPALASLPPVLDKAKRLLDQAAPAVRDLRLGAAKLPGFSSSSRRLVGELTPAMRSALDFVKYWAMSTNGRDGLSNYFRGYVATTPKSLLQVPGVGTGPGPEKKTPAPDGIVPQPALPKLPPVLGEEDSATGLSEEQENSLLDQLLGGRR